MNMTIAIAKQGMIRNYINTRLQPQELRVVSVTFLLACTAILSCQFYLDLHGRRIFGKDLGADFTEFYAVGTILNQNPPQNIYDFQAHAAAMHSSQPSLPYAHAPFEALLFRPFAALPYRLAFVAWIGFSLVLFVGGFYLLWPTLPALAPHRATILLLLLSFEPLAMECLVGGQVAPIYFFAVACCLRLIHDGRDLPAGMVLALATYKPTLLLLIGPMLLLIRQWRVLAGLAIGGVALAVVSIAEVGWSGCVEWVGAVRRLANIEGMPLHKAMDAKSFLQLLMPNHRGAATAFATVAAIAGAAVLFRLWWHRPRADLAWPLALVWGIVLSPYGPVYEMVVVAIGVLLLVNAAVERETRIPLRLKLLLALLYLVPWVSQHAAQRIGFQATTLVVVTVGVWAIRMASRYMQRPPMMPPEGENTV